jgi:single-strand DNA-binding protein
VSRSLNKASLIGNVGQDPELRTTASGVRVANFSLATSRTWNGASGDRQEKTEWHKCVVWNSQRGTGGGLVDVVEKYVRKGEKLYVEGRIEYRQYQDKEGQTRYVTEINVRDLLLLGSRGASVDTDVGSGSGGSAPRSRPAPAKAAASGRAPSAPGEAGGEDFEDFPGALEEEDDDLPF